MVCSTYIHTHVVHSQVPGRPLLLRGLLNTTQCQSQLHLWVRYALGIIDDYFGARLWDAIRSLFCFACPCLAHSLVGTDGNKFTLAAASILPQNRTAFRETAFAQLKHHAYKVPYGEGEVQYLFRWGSYSWSSSYYVAIWVDILYTLSSCDNWFSLFGCWFGTRC